MSLPKNPELSALWATDPRCAAEIVLDSLAGNGGCKMRAARELCVGVRTLHRWLRRYERFFASAAARLLDEAKQ